MPTHLDTLRSINTVAASYPTFVKVDADLSEEAGMDGNYARQLQAARMLDENPATLSLAALAPSLLEDIARRLLTSYLVAEQTGESIEEVCRLDVLVDIARLALPADVVEEAERDADATVRHLANLSA